MRNVMIKAQELAEAILESETYQKMKKQEISVRNDPDAARALADMIEKRNEVETILSDSKMDPNKLAEASREMEEAEERMNSNSMICMLKEYRNDSQTMMDNVNRILRLVITEETEDEILSNTEVTDESDNDTVKPERPDSGSSSGDTGSQKKGHWETRYETKPAWDEQVLVKEGWTEKILVKDAWDEEDTYCYAFGYDQVEVEVCNTCGARFHGGINQHLSETGHSGWHNEYENVGEQHCLEYRTEYIHHDAEYKYVYHEPEYRIVHHPEETISYKVWIED